MRIATFDLETNGLLDECTVVWCGVVKEHTHDKEDCKESRTFIFGPDDIPDLLECLSGYDVLFGHNHIAFDFPVLRKLYNYEYEGIKVDTLIMSRTQRPLRKAPAGCLSGPHSVKAWGMRLGKDKIDNDVWDHYTPLILQRCIQDVDIQISIYHALLEEGRGEGWAAAHKLNNKLFPLLQLQEERGWPIDQALLDTTLVWLDKWIGKIDEAIVPLLPIIAEKQEVKKDGEKNNKKDLKGKPKELKRRFMARREFPIELDEKESVVTVKQFEVGDTVIVVGTSKGKGFQGVVKRHGFKGGPASHGHRHSLRQAGSSGSAYPQHVVKGKRMAGRMGSDRVTVKNLSIMWIDEEKNVLAVKGAVPGAKGSVVEIISE